MPRSTHNGCSPNSRARLRLESLEDRTLLSASPVVSLDGLNVAGDYAGDHILVKYRQGAEPVALSGTSLAGPVGLVANLYRVNLSSQTTIDAALAEYRGDGRVATAEVDNLISASAIPNDPRFGDQWGLSGTSRDINATAAWDRTTGTRKITVALMDTGMDYTHPDLYQNVWVNQGEIPSDVLARLRSNNGDVDGDGLFTLHDLNAPINRGIVKDVNGNGRIDGGDLIAPRSQGGWADGTDQDGDGHKDDVIGWNFVDNNNNPMDLAGHGTHVAGIVGAMGNDGIGVAGVNWNVELMTCKFIGPSGGTVSQFVAALDYAVKHGAKVSNNSWSGAANSQVLVDAVAAARNAGHVFVAAAGNSSSNNDQAPIYPATLGLDNVISVAASDRNGALASFSNYGAKSVDLAAPGVEILSTLPGGNYGLNSGTSMATPFVTGAVALVWGKNPTWTYRQVISQILATTDKSTALQGKVATGGILNVAAAIGSAQTASTTAAKVVSAVPMGPSASAMSSVRVTFDRAINFSTFTAADCTLKLPSGRIIAVSNVKLVSGTSGKTFDVVFATQTAAGTYTLKIGPYVKDTTGVNMAAYAGTFPLPRVTTTAGPKIVASQPMGPSSSAMSSVRVTFDRAINYSTFTAADCTLKLPSGATIAVSTVKLVSGTSGKTFDVVFATQTAAGTYTLKIGPYVKDTAGISMVAYTGTYKLPFATTTTGPKIVASQAKGPSASAMSSVRVTFDRAINYSTFTAADCTLTLPSGRIIAVSNVKQVDGKTFDVVFATQTAAGTYTLKIGPYVKDTAGVSMVAFTGTYKLPFVTTTTSAAKVVSAVPMGPSASTMSSVRVTFDRAINYSTFTAADCTLKLPSGATIAVSNVKLVSGTSGKTFDVVFATQSAPGTYVLKIGPYVKDTTGVNMAAYTRYFALPRVTTTVTPPKVVSSTASGPSANTISSVRVTFDRAIQAGTFTAADCVLTDPSGVRITVSSVKLVSGTTRSFDVVFAAQSKPGAYTLKIGPYVKDLAGTNMTAFTGTYRISGAATYATTTAVAITPNGRAVALLTVSDGTTIGDLNVKVNVTYPHLIDLYQHLQAPDGTDVVLMKQMGGTSANLTNTTFDDEAGTHVAFGTGPYSGSYQPLSPLSILDGKPIKGTWKLWAEDRGGYSGSVSSFSLSVTPKAG